MAQGRNDTQELKDEQAERRREERQLAESATQEHETAQHIRRADKAEYLQRKLAERERSERRTATD
jgi:hypothetical protein